MISHSHGAWVANLAATFTNVGFQKVVEDRAQRNAWHLSAFHDVTLLAMEEVSWSLPNGAEIREMLQQAAKEYEDARRGISIVSDRVTAVGMKPKE